MYDSFDRNVPVFLQIKDRLKSDILNGVFSPRDKIPSVRQLALDMSVNPNTVQRALNILEEEGLIVTEGTTGKFVTDDDGSFVFGVGDTLPSVSTDSGETLKYSFEVISLTSSAATVKFTAK